MKGWNKEGIPTKEALEKMGLGHVAEDFIQRGILSEDETADVQTETQTQ